MLSALTLGLQMGLTTAMPMPASVIALGTQPQFEVDAYTRQIEDRGGWWLELDDRLLVVAPATALPELVAGEQVLDELGWIRPDELALQARGCAIHPSAPLPAIARAGRYALVRTPATLLPYQLPEISEWRPVVPNRSIAQDWRARGRIDLAKRTVNPAVQQRVDTVDRDRWFGVLEDLAIYDQSSSRYRQCARLVARSIRPPRPADFDPCLPDVGNGCGATGERDRYAGRYHLAR